MNRRPLVVRVSLAACAGVGLLALLSALPAGDAARPMLGFSPESAERQRALEARFLDLPDPDILRTTHRHLTEKPRVAGSRDDRLLAEWMADEWRRFGLETVEIVEHDVFLSTADRVDVEAVAPTRWRATLEEPPLGDQTRAEVPRAFHAYSGSGDITAAVVFAGAGGPSEYEWLAERGVSVAGAIVLVRYETPYSYRGYQAYLAQQHGAAGILIYSDPAGDGHHRGATYPHGPWGPPGRLQRGAISFDFLVPGDPLTPGWPSTRNAERIQPDAAVSLPRIVSLPIADVDAGRMLDALGGPEAPAAWAGGLRGVRRVGPGPLRVRLRVDMHERVTPVWTVIGRMTGSRAPDEVVVLGNHRDSWTAGGVDPGSGSAALMEVARALGALAQDGWRPARTIVLSSWDAEEFNLISSTEWGEEHEERLRDGAVAYLNVDSGVSGGSFEVSAVPSLHRAVGEVAAAVPAPTGPGTLQTAWNASTAEARGRAVAEGEVPAHDRIGGGSDYVVFLNRLGVPIADMAFRGPYGVYHTRYDDHRWVAEIADPGFHRHAALTRFWGVLALRLANADVVPLDPRPYAAAIARYLDETERRWPAAPGSGSDARRAAPAFGRIRHALDRFAASAAVAGEGLDAVSAGDSASAGALDAALRTVERDLLAPDGLPGRPWYRHLIYAPAFTYEAAVLPGLSEAVRAADVVQLEREAERLEAALDRAAATLRADWRSPNAVLTH